MAFLRRQTRIFRLARELLLAALVMTAVPAVAPAPPARAAAPKPEYQIKAVFLFNFAQFVDWPARVFKTPTSPIVIGILGDDPFGSYLDDLVKGESVGSRPVVIQRFRAGQDYSGCHLLFVALSEAGRIEQIASGLHDHSVLTLGEGAAFCRLGGMVGFVMDHGKVKLRINLKAATAADLTISSKILTPATIVSGDK